MFGMNLYSVYFTDGSQGEVNAKGENDAIATAQARYNKTVARVSFVKKVESVQHYESDFDRLQRNSING